MKWTLIPRMEARTSVEIQRQRSDAQDAVSRVPGGSAQPPPGTLEAQCHLCGPMAMAYSRNFGRPNQATGRFEINWREQLVCPECGLNNRMRATVHFLQEYCRIDGRAALYITEQTTPLYSLLRSRLYPSLIGSEFLGAACELGAMHGTLRNEDLTRLTFQSESLGAVLSFDVLEHVPGYLRALTEVYRCLAPDGHFVFSAPFDFNASRTLIRARLLDDGSIQHLQRPEYHGDPLGSGKGVLCYQTFGWELLDQLRAIGFCDVHAVDYWSMQFGYLGLCVLFIARKPADRHPQSG